MEELNKLRTLYKLKTVYRFASVENRKESVAEHIYSCFFLADFFMELSPGLKLDKVKVYELLLYHDVPEIETGDNPLHPKVKKKEINEIEAMEKLQKNLPNVMKDKIYNLFLEFEEKTSMEAKFAQAIDKLDGEIHEMDYKKDWKDWTEDFLRCSKEKYFEEFPVIKEYFEKLMVFLKKEEYI